MHPYKKYIGGPRGVERWEEAGQVQMSYLLAEGLRPDHKLLDVGCGAFRLGKLIIPYLNEGNYFGIEKEKWIVEAGLSEELPPELVQEKKPTILTDGSFDYSDLGETFQVPYVWAHMITSSLSPQEATLFLRNTDSILSPGGRIYVTYWGAKRKSPPVALNYPPGTSWSYTDGQMLDLATGTGLTPVIRRNWRWAKNQRLAMYLKAP